MRFHFKAFAANQWLVFAIKIALGGCFLAASLSKLQNPDYFTAIVVSYGLLPDIVSRLYGLLLPWAELAAGCALILGIFPVYASWLSILLTYSFAFAGIYQLVSSGQSACGCFGRLLQFNTPVALGIDIVLIIMAIELIFHDAQTGFLSIGALLQRYFATVSKKRLVYELSSKLAVVALAVLVTAVSIKATNVPSKTEYQIDAILDSRKYPVLYFFADGCALCEQFKPVIDEIELEYSAKITVLRINYDKSPEEVRRFAVVTTPTVLIIADKTRSGLYVFQRFEAKIDGTELRESLPSLYH